MAANRTNCSVLTLADEETRIVSKGIEDDVAAKGILALIVVEVDKVIMIFRVATLLENLLLYRNMLVGGR
jgi:hypothetical protein